MGWGEPRGEPRPYGRTWLDDSLRLQRIQSVADEQAEDEGLWFDAATVPEAYLQQELRRLHLVIESPDA